MINLRFKDDLIRTMTSMEQQETVYSSRPKRVAADVLAN
jgi:hypothetical protein